MVLLFIHREDGVHGRLNHARQTAFALAQRRGALGHALLQFQVERVDLGSRPCADLDLVVDAESGNGEEDDTQN
jgi:hypothetical protein